MKKRIGRVLSALLCAALAFTAFAPTARAEDADWPIYCPYWLQYTGCAYLPVSETVIRTWSEMEPEEYRFEYELNREGENVREIIGRKYDQAGTLVEIRSYNGRGRLTEVLSFRGGKAVRMTEYSYCFNGIMYDALAEERVTDLETGKISVTAFYQTDRGRSIPVREGEKPGFSFDPDTRQISTANSWEEPTLSAAVLGPGESGRLWEGMKLSVSWPYEGTMSTEAWYELLPSGEKGKLLSTHLENHSWFDGPEYVLEVDYTGKWPDSTEDWYQYNSAGNFVEAWTHSDNEATWTHRYTYVYFNGSELEELSWQLVGDDSDD